MLRRADARLETVHALLNHRTCWRSHTSMRFRNAIPGVAGGHVPRLLCMKTDVIRLARPTRREAAADAQHSLDELRRGLLDKGLTNDSEIDEAIAAWHIWGRDPRCDQSALSMPVRCSEESGRFKSRDRHALFARLRPDATPAHATTHRPLWMSNFTTPSSRIFSRRDWQTSSFGILARRMSSRTLSAF